MIDHMDLGGQSSIEAHYENRLRLLEICDVAGFYGYHITEHHCTPLGGGASPSVFLAAAAQRTKRLRLGTLVYALPAHHPVRLTEEIGMIDQMSGGRIDLGFGRGSVPMELEYFGIEPSDARAIYEETLACVIQGLSTGKINFDGKFFQIKNAPIFQRPKQQPHPPIWYGVHSLESAERAAVEGFNIVCNEPLESSAAYIDVFKTTWSKIRPSQPLPKIGVSRSVVVGKTDDEAWTLARRAHAQFQKSFSYMHTLHNKVPRLTGREADYDELVSGGRGIAGTPRAVVSYLREEMPRMGANYCVMRMAFGDMTAQEMQSSVNLFVKDVVPELKSL